MPDLHGWITRQIDRREDLANRAAHYGRLDWPQPATSVVDVGDSWPITTEAGPIAEHIAVHDPVAVLRRCEADRRILSRHRLNPDAYWADAAMCHGCGDEGEMAYARTENLNDCPELLDLAHAYGLTPEILAGLDRPKEGERPEYPGPTGHVVPDSILALYEETVARALATQLIAADKLASKDKALKILDPELKKISTYVPVSEEQP